MADYGKADVFHNSNHGPGVYIKFTNNYIDTTGNAHLDPRYIIECMFPYLLYTGTKETRFMENKSTEKQH